MNVNVVFSVTFAALFTYFNCGRDVYQKEAHLKEMISKLKEIGEKRKQKLNEYRTKTNEDENGGLKIFKLEVGSTHNDSFETPQIDSDEGD